MNQLSLFSFSFLFTLFSTECNMREEDGREDKMKHLVTEPRRYMYKKRSTYIVRAVRLATWNNYVGRDSFFMQFNLNIKKIYFAEQIM